MKKLFLFVLTLGAVFLLSPSLYASSLPGPNPEPIMACPENWDPVCGQSPQKVCMGPGCESEIRTYSNMCFLEMDYAEFLYEGECRIDETPLPEPTDTKYYIGDLRACEVTDYMCEGGWGHFSDDIGCGCEKKSQLSYETQEKLDSILQKFFRKLEEKNYSDDTNISIIESIIERLKDLSSQEPKYEDVVQYLIEKLEEFIEKYYDVFFDIEKIFKDI